MKATTSASRLDSCFLRVDRAEKHLAELRELLAEIARRERYSVIPHKNFSPVDNITFIRRNGPIVIPSIGAILIGEICYNLRTALDYLAFALTEFDCGQKPRFTQFPIEDSKDKFRSWKKKAVSKGMNARHAACFEVFQPYKGCDWSKHLAEFRNYDTHNEFVRIDAQAVIETEANPGSSTYVINTKHPITGATVKMEIAIYIQILFGNGLPIVETLEEIKGGVAQTLADFKPKFDR